MDGEADAWHCRSYSGEFDYLHNTVMLLGRADWNSHNLIPLPCCDGPRADLSSLCYLVDGNLWEIDIWESVKWSDREVDSGTLPFVLYYPRM